MSDDQQWSFLQKTPSKKKNKKHSTVDSVEPGKEALYQKAHLASRGTKVMSKSMFGRRSGTK